MSCQQALRLSPAIVAPLFTLVIEPAAIPKVQDIAAMRAPALLTPSFRALETDGRRELGPVDRIEPALLGTDWHQTSSKEASAR